MKVLKRFRFVKQSRAELLGYKLVGVPLPEELAQRFADLAGRNRRSLGAEAVVAIEGYVAAQERRINGRRRSAQG